jgi:hypothetical protein
LLAEGRSDEEGGVGRGRGGRGGIGRELREVERDVRRRRELHAELEEIKMRIKDAAGDARN